MSAWLASIVAAVVQAVLGWFGQRRDAAQQRADDHDAGARDAAAETDQTTKDIADERSRIAARPDDAQSVADRLRAKADAARRRGGAESHDGA